MLSSYICSIVDIHKNTEFSNFTEKGKRLKMQYPVVEEKELPPQVAAALWKYIDTHGLPPPVVESIEITVNGAVVVVDLWSVKETK